MPDRSRSRRGRPSRTGPAAACSGSQRWPAAGFEWSVHPESVVLSGSDAGQIGVPDVPVDLVEADPVLGVVAVVDQAQFDTLGDFGEHREVGSGAVVDGTERIAAARARRWAPTAPTRARCPVQPMTLLDLIRCFPGGRPMSAAGLTTSRWRPHLPAQLTGHGAHVGRRQVMGVVIDQHIALHGAADVGVAHGIGEVQRFEQREALDEVQGRVALDEDFGALDPAGIRVAAGGQAVRRLNGPPSSRTSHGVSRTPRIGMLLSDSFFQIPI